ncbi:MAG: toll/interleukin-1 receptor domain-containing protein [Lachnospiraceae bacterium]|nr:toll/interleukin-1 receptor domain-containing protein [Lachnospiraceae bacterium]
MPDVFISWSGEKANKYAEFLENILEQVFDKRANIFYSGNIEAGAVWLEKINQALNESKVGIIVLTKDNVNKPWINFEAGAIFKADRTKTLIIPICVDISHEDLERHPLSFFHSRYYFTWESIIQLFELLNCQLGWQYKMINLRKIRDEFDAFCNENNNTCKMENLLRSNRINIYEKGCFMAEIPEEKYWKIRQELVETSKGSIILAGQSLEDAFGEKSVILIVEKLKKCIMSNQISEMKILIMDPSLFSDIQNFNKLETSPLGRVSLTMDTLINVIFPICQERNCDVKVFFIPLLEIDHAVINDEYMAFRSTKLWTRDGNYKGSFMIYINCIMLKLLIMSQMIGREKTI